MVDFFGLSNFKQLSNPQNSRIDWSFILVDFFVYGILLFASIGSSNPQTADLVYFYIIFGISLSTIPTFLKLYGVKFSLRSGKPAPEIDVVTAEQEDSGYIKKYLSIKNQLLIFMPIVGILTVLQIISSQSVWVSGPTFAIASPFEGVISTPLFQALLSALVGGWLETRALFGFVFSTILKNFVKKFGAFGIFMSVVAIVTIFTTFHWYVDGSDFLALRSIAAFALINALLTLFTRSTLENVAYHGVNNFVAVFLKITKIGFQVLSTAKG